jgi:hypothetical protein
VQRSREALAMPAPGSQPANDAPSPKKVTSSPEKYSWELESLNAAESASVMTEPYSWEGEGEGEDARASSQGAAAAAGPVTDVHAGPQAGAEVSTCADAATASRDEGVANLQQARSPGSIPDIHVEGESHGAAANGIGRRAMSEEDLLNKSQELLDDSCVSFVSARNEPMGTAPNSPGASATLHGGLTLDVDRMVVEARGPDVDDEVIFSQSQHHVDVAGADRDVNAMDGDGHASPPLAEPQQSATSCQSEQPGHAEIIQMEPELSHIRNDAIVSQPAQPVVPEGARAESAAAKAAIAGKSKAARPDASRFSLVRCCHLPFTYRLQTRARSSRRAAAPRPSWCGS